MGLVIREGEKAFATRSQLFPVLLAGIHVDRGGGGRH